jgi:hypothetical protein
MKFGETKSFIKAAKEVGLDKDERKLVAMDPALLLEGLSDEIRNNVKPETLIEFFSALQGEEVDHKRILEIGNLLYRYRNDVRTPEKQDPDSLNEKDRQLLSLTYKLLEGALYSAKLYGLKKEQAAALAFTVNVIAKLAEQRQFKDLADFESEKLERLVASVHNYEQESLFPGDEKGQTLGREKTIIRLDTQIKTETDELEAFDRETDWKLYFSGLAASLEEALATLERDGHDFFTVGYLIDNLRSEEPEALRYCRGEMSGLIEKQRIGPYEYQSVEPLLVRRGLIGLTQRFSKKSVDIAANFTSDEYGYKYLCKTYLSESPQSGPAKKTQRLSGFDGLGEATKFPRMVSAVNAISPIFDGKKCEGPLMEYEKRVSKISRLMERRRQLLIQDDQFSLSERRIKAKTDNPATLMYLIKAQLIVDSILQRWDESRKAGAEYNLATRSHPYEFKAENGPAVHAFIIDKNYVPDYDLRKGPAYASLHFLPEEIPFAVWSSRYLKSK